jgi:hypothetical protein
MIATAINATYKKDLANLGADREKSRAKLYADGKLSPFSAKHGVYVADVSITEDVASEVAARNDIETRRRGHRRLV